MASASAPAPCGPPSSPPAAPRATTNPDPGSADDLESALTEIWKSVLGIPAVSSTDDFADLGGNSLAMARIIARVRQTLGVQEGLAALVAARTVQEMAASLKGTATEDAGVGHALDQEPPAAPERPGEAAILSVDGPNTRDSPGQHTLYQPATGRPQSSPHSQVHLAVL